jgi:hypothetical protein
MVEEGVRITCRARIGPVLCGVCIPQSKVGRIFLIISPRAPVLPRHPDLAALDWGLAAAEHTGGRQQRVGRSRRCDQPYHQEHPQLRVRTTVAHGRCIIDPVRQAA